MYKCVWGCGPKWITEICIGQVFIRASSINYLNENVNEQGMRYKFFWLEYSSSYRIVVL